MRVVVDLYVNYTLLRYWKYHIIAYLNVTVCRRGAASVSRGAGGVVVGGSAIDHSSILYY